MDRQPPAGDDPGCGLSEAAAAFGQFGGDGNTCSTGRCDLRPHREPLRFAFAESRGRLERPASSHVASASAGLGMDLVERYRLGTAAAGSDRLYQRHHRRGAGSVAGL
ncbi:hypothetical protein [Xanthomonas sacchari]|uniref:Uncharacterized protein n=1 Tax=Xanthomonas sacchari TaxID=56458 RepID=A0AA46Y924_9XANT|nr:hypothetical protein [Xanthomonas sacchari]UYK89039.1 hypothetical protein NG824_00815 [Xanthomonas sacchari]